MKLTKKSIGGCDSDRNIFNLVTKELNRRSSAGLRFHLIEIQGCAMLATASPSSTGPFTRKYSLGGL